jgi:hypothetical protein
MIVPITALMATTTSESPIVRRRADSAWGAVMAFQKPLQPFSEERTTIAASGISTIRLM